jgi:hypothetical protein
MKAASDVVAGVGRGPIEPDTPQLERREELRIFRSRLSMVVRNKGNLVRRPGTDRRASSPITGSSTSTVSAPRHLSPARAPFTNVRPVRCSPQ